MNFFESIVANFFYIIFKIIMCIVSTFLLIVFLAIPFRTVLVFVECLVGYGSWLKCILGIVLCLIEGSFIMTIRQDRDLNRLFREIIYWWNWKRLK